MCAQASRALSYDLRLPDELQAAALKLLTFSVAQEQLVVDRMWPYLDEIGQINGKHIYKVLESQLPRPAGIPSRPWRCILEGAGRTLRGQADRKRIFDLLHPLVADEDLENGNQNLIPLAYQLRDELAGAGEKVGYLLNIIEQSANYYAKNERLPADYYELQTRPIDSLVAVSTLSSTLDVTLPVQASFLGLGVQPTVVVTAGGEFFGETPTVTVQDFETLYALDDALSAGFEALASFGDNLDVGDELGAKLPFFDTSLGEVADLGGLLSDTLLEPLNALLNSVDPRSADTLDGAITDALSNLGASSIQVTHNLVGDVLSFDVIFETERRAGVSLDFSSGDPEAGDQLGDLAAEMAELGLELDGEFTLDLILDVGFDMTFGVDLTELPGVGDAFFFTLNDHGEPTIQARLEGSGQLSGRLAILDITAELIQPNLTAGLTVALLDPNGDGRTTLNELQGATLEEARKNLAEAVQLVLETNRLLAEESLAGEEVIREPLALPTP